MTTKTDQEARCGPDRPTLFWATIAYHRWFIAFDHPEFGMLRAAGNRHEEFTDVFEIEAAFGRLMERLVARSQTEPA